MCSLYTLAAVEMAGGALQACIPVLYVRVHNKHIYCAIYIYKESVLLKSRIGVKRMMGVLRLFTAGTDCVLS